MSSTATCCASTMRLATPQFIEHYGCDNMLKAGIVFADKVTTVSPTYAREICEPDLGESLDGVLRTRGGDLWGILNGIDVDTWNPQTDEALPAHYSAKSLWRKKKVRDALLEELGLAPAGENTAVISMVGRLTPQKGIDLVRYALDEIMAEDVRMIVLGSGYTEFEDFLRDAENRYKGRLCSYIGYNGELSHRIYAGSDLFLMPSLFEPCGISQMIAMRYGTLPIVRETGGLRDTVVPYNEFTGEGNGFSFANYDAGEMLEIIRYALRVWRDPKARKRLIKQAMEAISASTAARAPTPSCTLYASFINCIDSWRMHLTSRRCRSLVQAMCRHELISTASRSGVFVVRCNLVIER